LISKKQGISIDIYKIPLDDKKTYDMLSSGDTVGVVNFKFAGGFPIQVNTRNKFLKKLKPECFEDLCAMDALYQPKRCYREKFTELIKRKNSGEKVKYIHPIIEQHTRNTYGVIVYKEQIIQILADVAGLSLTEAELLSRLLKKKKLHELSEWKDKFMAGSSGKGIESEMAEKIWRMLHKAGAYAMSKASATAHTMLTYQTAWLKANYPIEFYSGCILTDLYPKRIKRFMMDAHKSGVRKQVKKMVLEYTDTNNFTQ
jgi:DNA polymerase-3 subunit alpha